MKKVLIEEPNIELLELFDLVSQDAEKEKLSGSPINEMLYWWTRKPLVVGRAMTLASTLTDIKDVKDLMGLGRDKRAYTYIPDAGVYKKKLGQDPSEIKVLDPFGGGGNLIFEAKRLGLDCTVSDYNPVAYLLEKSVLEYPPKYGPKLAEDFEKYAKLVIEKTQEEIGKFYEKNDLVYLWVWCIKCLHCGQRVPLTNQMWIANTPKNKVGIRFEVTPDKNFTIKLIQNMTSTEGIKFTQKGGNAICIGCRNSIDYETLTTDIATRKDRELIVKLVQNVKKRDYVLADDEDKKLFKTASEYMQSKLNEYQKENLIPDEDILPTNRRESMLWHYGIKYWKDYYSDRQLLTLTTLLKNIKSITKTIPDQEYAKVMALYLGMWLCKHVNSNSMGLAWNVGGEKYAHTLTFRQPRVVYNHVEINPFVIVAGSLINIIHNITDAILHASTNVYGTHIILESILKLPKSETRYDLIITDPPYLDDVIYSEFSEFFYVWLRRSLQNYYEELPARPGRDEDICESWGRFGNKKLANDFFRKGIKESFKSMNNILQDDGLLVVFFAHSSVDAWNLLLDCIREARFKVVSSYAIHTENTNNPIATGKTAFMSSVVIACRKITEESTTYFEDIVPQVDDKIREMLSKIPQERLLSLPITDLLIMVYGKVLEATTQHTILKSYTKDFKPDFEVLIEDAREFIMKEIVTKLTGRTINTLGPEISFYLLAKIFYRGILGGDDLTKIARTYGLDDEKIEKTNLGIKEKGIMKLYPLYELEFSKKPEEIDPKNLHEQLSYLAHVVDTKDITRIPSLLTLNNFRADDLRQMISLLIKSFRLRINKGEQLTGEEQKELKILESLVDVAGVAGVRSEQTLNSFMDME